MEKTTDKTCENPHDLDGSTHLIVLKSLFEIHLTALVKFWFPIDYDLRTFTIDHHHQAVEVAATNARGLVEESLQESSSLSLILPLISIIILSSE